MRSSLTFSDSINVLLYVNEEQDSCATQWKETCGCVIYQSICSGLWRGQWTPWNW